MDGMVSLIAPAVLIHPGALDRFGVGSTGAVLLCAQIGHIMLFILYKRICGAYSRSTFRLLRLLYRLLSQKCKHLYHNENQSSLPDLPKDFLFGRFLSAGAVIISECNSFHFSQKIINQRMFLAKFL